MSDATKLLFPEFMLPEHCFRTECNNVLVSFSAGRTSAYMAKRMLEDPYWSSKRLLFVFANTGKEREETLKFADQCDKAFGLNLVWVEAEIIHELTVGTKHRFVTYETASRNGEPFEEMIKKYGIPNQPYPHCNRELKLQPINSYARSAFGGEPYVSAIGIRMDEMSRVKPAPDKVYPLVGMQTTVLDVRQFWNNQPFDLQLKDYEGNCDLCWKKSLRKQLTILKENPQVADWWHQMEVKYPTLERRNSGETVFHRNNLSTAQLLEMSKQPFISVKDPHWKEHKNVEMDAESPCACMNEEPDDEQSSCMIP